MGSAERGDLLFRIQIHSLLSLFPSVQISCIETSKLLLSSPLAVFKSFVLVEILMVGHANIQQR